MKLFQECQKNFAILGIDSHQQISFNARILITYSIYGLGFASSAAFFFFKANTVQEYSNNSYATTTLFVCSSVLINIHLKTEALFKFINNLEEDVLAQSETFIRMK